MDNRIFIPIHPTPRRCPGAACHLLLLHPAMLQEAQDQEGQGREGPRHEERPAAGIHLQG